MRKIFLTSGIIACMACPAFATTDIDYDATNGYSAEGYTNGPTCVEDITGQTEQNTTAEFEAIWTPNISGAITLVSSIYPSNDNTQTALYTGGANNDGLTTASLSTLYGVYGVGIYGSASDANNYAAATPSTPYTQLGTNPSKSGYTFNGFYSGATQVIDNSGAILSAANTQVTSAGGTATWYAHWTPVPTTITYACGTGVTGIGPSTQTSATYDASFYTGG